MRQYEREAAANVVAGVKKRAILLGLLGVALAIALVVWLGADKVMRSVLAIGWGGLAILVLWQLALYVVLALAWGRVCPAARFFSLVWGRLVREGGANCLPFSEIGGLVFGARALTLTGVAWERSVASSLADVVAEFVGEIPFILFGLAILLMRGTESSLMIPLVIGLLLLVAGASALIWAERHIGRLFHAIGRHVHARWTRRAEHEADVIQRELEAVLNEPRRIGVASGIHFAGWIGGGVAVWLAYTLLGGRISLADAIAIEGLLSGALAVAFLVPGALGVQEAAYVLIGHAFGMPAELSIGLSLLRRARNIIIGVPALIAWQIAEARELRRAGSEERA